MNGSTLPSLHLSEGKRPATKLVSTCITSAPSLQTPDPVILLTEQ